LLQPLRHVRAHPSQSDNTDFHLSPLSARAAPLL
jgi:hypothetical protein